MQRNISWDELATWFLGLVRPQGQLESRVCFRPYVTIVQKCLGSSFGNNFTINLTLNSILRFRLKIQIVEILDFGL